MIDPWRTLPCWNKPCNVPNPVFDEVYRQAMQAVAFASAKLRVLRGTTLEVIDQVGDNSVDLAYIDGDHTLRGITIDLLNVWKKVKPGGYVGGDDLSPSIWQHAESFEPTLVFPFALHFAEAMRAKIYALPYQQFLIEKPDAAGGVYEFDDLVGLYSEPALREQMRSVDPP